MLVPSRLLGGQRPRICWAHAAWDSVALATTPIFGPTSTWTRRPSLRATVSNPDSPRLTLGLLAAGGDEAATITLVLEHWVDPG